MPAAGSGLAWPDDPWRRADLFARFEPFLFPYHFPRKPLNQDSNAPKTMNNVFSVTFLFDTFIRILLFYNRKPRTQ